MATAQDDARTLIAETPFPSAEATQCPFPLYEAFRRESPVYQLPTGEYVISRHADIFSVTRQPEIFSSHHSIYVDGYMQAATLEDHRNPDMPWAIVNADPPDHTWKRKIAFEMFKPGRLREREPLVRDFVDELIDTFIDRGECEFVHEFADLLPAKVILTLFGMPLEHLDRALTWGRYEGFGTRFARPDLQQAARDGIVDLGEFLRDRILESVESPGDDDLSIHVQRHIEHQGKLDLPNLIAETSNLFIGGIITTTHLLSSMMMLFIQNPEQQAKARSSQSLLKKSIEESLRIESPVQMGPRLVVQDTEVGGVKIPAGSIVLVVWGSANHDENVFKCPEQFDVERSNAKDHMAFGNGPHFCMGAPLGRMEAMVAFERIFARMENLRFAPGKNDFANHWAVIFRGPQELHIEFDNAHLMATAIDLSGGLGDAVEYGLVDHPRLADMREGVSVWIYDDQGRFGFPRVCLEAMGPDFDPKRLQVNLAFPDGRVLIGDPRGAAGPPLDDEGKATIFTGGPLEFRLLGPWQGWSVVYDGLMTDTTTAATIERRTGDAPRIPVRFEMEVTNAAPPWIQGRMSRQADEQLEKTDAIFVGGQRTEFENGLRYEQLVRAKGTLRIGAEEWDFTGSCSRIHRQGFRNLTGFEGHVWQSALFPSGRGFGHMWLLPNNYKEGYIFDGTRMLPAEVVEVSWMTKMYPSGAGEDVSCVLESELGRHEIRAETVYSRYIPIGDEFETEGFWPIHWQQAGVRYTWDGEESYGMMERSSQAEVVSG